MYFIVGYIMFQQSSSVEPVAATQAPNSSVVHSATAPPAAPQGAVGDSASTTFSSMEDMRRKNPKLYKMMLESIARNMITQMQDSQDREKAAWRSIREGRG